MRSSRIAVVATASIAAPALAGCGGDGSSPFGDDRAEVVRVVRASAAAEATGDARSSCELMTTGAQRGYITDFEAGLNSDAAPGPRDTDACAAAYRRLQRGFARSSDRDAVDHERERNDRVRDAAKDDDRVRVKFEDGTATVTVDAASGRNDDGFFLLEREDSRWRIGIVPETATLR